MANNGTTRYNHGFILQGFFVMGGKRRQVLAVGKSPTRRLRTHRFCLVCICCILSACQTSPARSYPVLDDPETVHTLREVLVSRYPASFESVHRSILTIRRREFNLDGYLRMDSKEGHRLLVTAGMGNAMFELYWPQGDPVELVRTSGLIDERTLLEGPGKDIERIFDTADFADAVLTSPSTNTFALESPKGNLNRIRYIFDKSTRNILAYERMTQGRVRYRVEYGDYSDSMVEGYSIPTTIVIRNGEMGYTITIRVIDMNCGD